MAYVNVPPAPPVSYVARAPAAAKPPQTHAEPKPPAAAGANHGPAVILGGSLAKSADRRVREEPAPARPPRHLDRVI